jgi:hypothetical protein
MTRSEAQRWLALYFLLYTGFVGGYVLIFGESWLLPISKADANDSFQIIIPVFLGPLCFSGLLAILELITTSAL